MVGIQRLPALLFYAPHKSLTELNLGDYEILNNEPLHDISHHTQNIYDELPYHLPKEMKTAFKKVKDSSFNSKEAKNGSDYREYSSYSYSSYMVSSKSSILLCN